MRIVLFCIFLFSSLSCWAKVYSLKDCILVALKNNPEIGYSIFGKKAQTYNVNMVVSQFFPVIDINSYWKRYDARNLNPQTETYWGISASWDIFTGFSTLRSYQMERLNLGAAREKVRETMIEVAYQVIKAYTDLLTKKALVQARKKSLEDARKNYELVKRRYEVGLSPYADLISAKSRLESASHDLIRAKTELEKARGALNVVMGFSVIKRVDIKEFSLSFKKTPDFESVLKNAIANRPEIKQAELSISAQSKKVSVIKSEFLPTVSVQGEYGKYDESFFPDDRYAWSVKAFVKIPIFSGLSSVWKLKREKANLQRARFNYKMVELSVEKDVWNAYQELLSAKKQLEAARKYLQSAEEDMKVMRGKYMNGLASVVDLTTTEAHLADARSKFVEAKYNIVKAYYALIKAEGFIPGLEK